VSAEAHDPRDRTPLVVVVGATGTGKSELSLDLAASLTDGTRGAEVVSADAMQLYRGMDIGTAKLPPEARRGIPHHELDVLEVTEEASVADYQARARARITEIIDRGNIPLLVGGSGLYVSSVIHDFSFPGTDAEVRAGLEQDLEQYGPGILHRRLQEVDPEAARAIGPHNGRRLVRALEVITLTGEPFGSGLPEGDTFWHRNTVIVGLSVERTALVQRLDARVQRMWQDGLLDEVRGLLPRGLKQGVTASRAIGYAQAIAQLEGELSESEAIAQTASLTRKYARRQVSWFKRYRGAHWIAAADSSRAAAAHEWVARARQ